MFGAISLPVHHDEASMRNHHHQPQPASSPYRPNVSSPLSSSPLRALSTTPPPLSSRDVNARLPRETQSSPIQASRSSTSAVSVASCKFAARGPVRPNPAAQKREATQESRRKMFLKNVRQRQEDRRWEMRGGEQEVRFFAILSLIVSSANIRDQLLKLEWFSLNREIQHARNADLDGLVLESDIEDAARLRDEVMSKPRGLPLPQQLRHGTDGEGDVDMDADAMMVDMLEQEQQAELEALVSSMPDANQQQHAAFLSSSSRSPDSPHWSDDEDYDALFEDYISQEQQQQALRPASSGDMDLS